MKWLLPFSLLLLSSPGWGATATSKVSAAADRRLSQAFEIRYFSEASSPSYPLRRYTVTTSSVQPIGCTFYDKVKQITFRDRAHIERDILALRHDASQTLTAGKSRYVWPRIVTLDEREPAISYLSSSQVLKANHLGQEPAAFDALVATSPLIITIRDILPTATAFMCKTEPTSQPAIKLTLTSDGAARFGRFTSSHNGEILLFIANGHVLSAPTILDPISDGSLQIVGDFRNLGAAQRMADQLNHCAR